MQSIGAASAMSGVSVDTIRYYERTGVVPRPDRTASGRRTYGADDIARLRFVRRCRSLGFPIPDIRSLLDLAQTSEAPCPETVALGRRHLAEVRRKVDQLAGIERALADMLDRCHGNDGACLFLEELFDEAGAPTA